MLPHNIWNDTTAKQPACGHLSKDNKKRLENASFATHAAVHD